MTAVTPHVWAFSCAHVPVLGWRAPEWEQQDSPDLPRQQLAPNTRLAGLFLWPDCARWLRS